MKQAIEYKIEGIKCDACDYKDESVKVEDYPDWVNKPCPDCGENLLTEGDFAFVEKMINAASILNSMFSPREDDAEVVKTSIELDGTGSVAIEIADKERE